MNNVSVNMRVERSLLNNESFSYISKRGIVGSYSSYKFNCFKFVYFILREREREREQGRSKEEEGERKYQADSGLSAQSPMQGSNSQNVRS